MTLQSATKLYNSTVMILHYIIINTVSSMHNYYYDQSFFNAHDSVAIRMILRPWSFAFLVLALLILQVLLVYIHCYKNTYTFAPPPPPNKAWKRACITKNWILQKEHLIMKRASITECILIRKKQSWTLPQTKSATKQLRTVGWKTKLF